MRTWVGATVVPRKGPYKAIGAGMATGNRYHAVGTAAKKHRSTGVGACELYPEDPSGTSR